MHYHVIHCLIMNNQPRANSQLIYAQWVKISALLDTLQYSRWQSIERYASTMKIHEVNAHTLYYIQGRGGGAEKEKERGRGGGKSEREEKEGERFTLITMLLT